MVLLFIGTIIGMDQERVLWFYDCHVTAKITIVFHNQLADAAG